MHILGLHLSSTESETLEVGPEPSVLTNPPGDSPAHYGLRTILPEEWIYLGLTRPTLVHLLFGMDGSGRWGQQDLWLVIRGNRPDSTWRSWKPDLLTIIPIHRTTELSWWSCIFHHLFIPCYSFITRSSRKHVLSTSYVPSPVASEGQRQGSPVPSLQDLTFWQRRRMSQQAKGEMEQTHQCSHAPRKEEGLTHPLECGGRASWRRWVSCGLQGSRTSPNRQRRQRHSGSKAHCAQLWGTVGGGVARGS